jgi:hypothetical protein
MSLEPLKNTLLRVTEDEQLTEKISTLNKQRILRVLIELQPFKLNEGTLNWLCEDDNPSVKYLTMRHLLGKSESEGEVIEARRRIMEFGPVPRILSKLKMNGHYEDAAFVRKYGQAKSDFGYLPKYKATTWQLILFADLYADGEDDRIKRVCDFVLDHTYREDGLLSLLGRKHLMPCFQGNMLHSLVRLGYGEDPRIRNALATLVKYQRFDDGGFKTPSEWPYSGRKDRCSGSHSCYAGCARGLKAISVIPQNHWSDEMRDYVRRGTEFFLVHHVYQSSHDPSKLLQHWIDKLSFPVFVYSDFLDILDTLLGLGVRNKRMMEAINLLRSRQKPNGRWVLERPVSNMHVTLGTKGKENKWITYKALHTLKRWGTTANYQRPQFGKGLELMQS